MVRKGQAVVCHVAWPCGLTLRFRLGKTTWMLRSGLTAAHALNISPCNESVPKFSLIDESLIRRLRGEPADKRIESIAVELKHLQGRTGDIPTFTRKALLRLQDETRLELKLVTKAELQKENSPLPWSEFKNARVIFKRR